MFSIEILACDSTLKRSEPGSLSLTVADGSRMAKSQDAQACWTRPRFYRGQWDQARGTCRSLSCLSAAWEESSRRLDGSTGRGGVRFPALPMISCKVLMLVSRWLYALIVGIDANFRLKRKNVSSDSKDPGLCPGWAYFVEEKAYKAHLEKYAYLSKQSVRPHILLILHPMTHMVDRRVHVRTITQSTLSVPWLGSQHPALEQLTALVTI